MARYIIEEMPDLQKTGKRITYPKFARIDNTSIKELAQRVGDVSGFSAGDIEGVLLQTAIEMAHLMAEGRSVKIDGIGTFTPSYFRQRQGAGRSGRRGESSQRTKYFYRRCKFPGRPRNGEKYQRKMPTGKSTLEKATIL